MIHVSSDVLEVKVEVRRWREVALTSWERKRGREGGRRKGRASLSAGWRQRGVKGGIPKRFAERGDTRGRKLCGIPSPCSACEGVLFVGIALVGLYFFPLGFVDHNPRTYTV